MGKGGKTVSSTGDSSKDDINKDERCMWGPVNPSCCQSFRKPAWFLLCASLASFVQNMMAVGFVGVNTTTIERRFQLSSRQSGLIPSVYDIAALLCLLPVSYIGGHQNRAKFIAVGLFMMGIGNFIFSLPHFTTGLYQFSQAKQSMCEATNSSICDTDTGTSLSIYRFVFYLAQILNGTGGSALNTLAVTYLDDSLPVQTASLYTGIFIACTVFGPGVGFLIGGEILSVYTDVDQVDTSQLTIDVSNPRWIGAWWLGYLSTGVFLILISLPLFGFPKVMPGTESYRAEKEKEVYKGKTEKVSEAGKPSLGIQHILKSIRDLITNPTFVFLCLGLAFANFTLAGLSIFGPKQIEFQLNLSSSTAASYFGYVGLVTGGGAAFLGGWLSRYFNWNIRQILKFCIASSIVLLFVFLFYFFHCQNAPFAGITTEYLQPNISVQYLGSVQLDAACNAGCGCTIQDYNPVCGRDNIMYYSPCYAGCTTSFAGDKTKYSNCSCVMYNYTAQDVADSQLWMVQEGKCPTHCPYLPIILAGFGTAIFVAFLPFMPIITATLRCVTQDQRSLAMGIQWVIGRILGFIPGPIVVGSFIDMSCMAWQTGCSGTGACFQYDLKHMGYNMLGVCMTCAGLTAVSFLLALVLYRSGPNEDTVSISVDPDDPSHHTSTATISEPPQISSESIVITKM